MATKVTSAKDFGPTAAQAYATSGAAIELGDGVLDGALAPETLMRAALRMMNGDGLWVSFK